MEPLEREASFSLIWSGIKSMNKKNLYIDNQPREEKGFALKIK